MIESMLLKSASGIVAQNIFHPIPWKFVTREKKRLLVFQRQKDNTKWERKKTTTFFEPRSLLY